MSLRSSTWERLREGVRALLREHRTPGELARAVWLGAIIGCTPLFGFHLPICVALSWLLGLNQVAVYGAANVSAPPLVPLIGFASVQLGERLLRGRWLEISRAQFTWTAVPAIARHFFADWCVGGLLVGAALGGLGALAIYFAARRRLDLLRATAPNGERSELAVALARASARYASAPPRFRYYAWWKYRLDPCYSAIALLIRADDLVLDLGTGLGMLPVLLALLGRRAIGVEWDPAKLGAAAEAARGLDGIELLPGDVRTASLPECDVITLVDLLHYYDAPTQRLLLARCRGALRPGGRIVVRDGDGSRRGGARFTRLVERLATRLGWNRGPQIHFRAKAELRADLEALGLRVRDAELSGPLHPGNVLLVAEVC